MVDTDTQMNQDSHLLQFRNYLKCPKFDFKEENKSTVYRPPFCDIERFWRCHVNGTGTRVSEPSLALIIGSLLEQLELKTHPSQNPFWYHQIWSLHDLRPRRSWRNRSGTSLTSDPQTHRDSGFSVDRYRGNIS